MTDLDVDRLRTLAEKATPGPWEGVPQSDGSTLIAHPYETGKQMNPKGLRIVGFTMARGNTLRQDEANAGYLAAANPAAILALIAAYEQARDDAYERAARMCEANLLKVQLSTDHAINAGIKACAAAIRAMKGKA